MITLSACLLAAKKGNTSPLPEGFNVCLGKALALLPHAVDQRGCFLPAMLARLQAEITTPTKRAILPHYQALLPAWLAASAVDPSGRTLRRIGWFFCGASYCKLKCVDEAIRLGDHACGKCYRNKFSPTGNYTFPVEDEQSLLSGRMKITEDNGEELFYFHAEQAFRMEQFETGPLAAVRSQHAGWALRCTEVCTPYCPNAAQITTATMSLRVLAAASNDRIRGYLKALPTMERDPMLDMVVEGDRQWLAATHGRDVVVKAEELYRKDKNCFAGCLNDAEVLGMINKLE